MPGDRSSHARVSGSLQFEKQRGRESCNEASDCGSLDGERSSLGGLETKGFVDVEKVHPVPYLEAQAIIMYIHRNRYTM